MSSPVLSRSVSALLLELLVSGDFKWLQDDLARLVDPLISQLYVRLLKSSLSSTVTQSGSAVSVCCELLDGEMEETKNLLRDNVDRVVNSLFFKLKDNVRRMSPDVDGGSGGSVDGGGGGSGGGRYGGSGGGGGSSGAGGSAGGSSGAGGSAGGSSGAVGSGEGRFGCGGGSGGRSVPKASIQRNPESHQPQDDADDQPELGPESVIDNNAENEPIHDDDDHSGQQVNFDGNNNDNNRLVDRDQAVVIKKEFDHYQMLMAVKKEEEYDDDEENGDEDIELINLDDDDDDHEGDDADRPVVVEEVGEGREEEGTQTDQSDTPQVNNSDDSSIEHFFQRWMNDEIDLDGNPINSNQVQQQQQQQLNIPSTDQMDEETEEEMVDGESRSVANAPTDTRTPLDGSPVNNQSRRMPKRMNPHGDEQQQDNIRVNDSDEDTEVESRESDDDDEDEDYVADEEEEKDSDDPGEGTSRAVKRPRTSRSTTTKEKLLITVGLLCPQAECNQSFTKVQLKTHLKDIHKIGQFRCLVMDCGQSFNISKSMAQHRAQSHQNLTEFRCSKCPKLFNSYNKLARHFNLLHQLGEFLCSFPACHFKADCRTKVYVHYKQRHKPKLTCSHCSYRTSNKTELKTHEMTHLAIKPYRCIWPGCDYTSVTRSASIVHIRTKHLTQNTSSDAADYVEKKDE